MKIMRLCFFVCLLLASLLTISLTGIALAQNEEEPISENATLVQQEEAPISENATLVQEEEAPLSENVTITKEAEPKPELIANQEEPTIKESIKLSPDFPTVEAIAGGEFDFRVTFTYLGVEPKVFDLRTSAPPDWEVYMTPRYEKDRKITSVNLKPTMGAGDELNVVATAPFWPLPEPGDYKITIEAISDTVQSSTELTAKVTAKYTLQTTPTNQLYNTKTKAGKDNAFSITVTSLSTAVVDNIQFTHKNPDGWTVEFKPDKIDALEAFSEKTVDVNIKPPAKTVAGDYMITLQASGKQATASEMNIRVTVETPTVWGWVGVAIILIVVIGLIAIFMRFSRR